MGFYSRHTTWRDDVREPAAPVVSPALCAAGFPARDRQDVEVDRNARGPCCSWRVSSQYRENEIVALTTVRDPFEEYTLFLPAGDYGFFVFADLNGNGLFERNELVGQDDADRGENAAGPTALWKARRSQVNYGDPGKTVFRVRVKVSNRQLCLPLAG